MSLGPHFLQARGDPAPDYTKAYSLPPSQVWDGNDGAWSSFVIRVGTPAQSFRVLPSTNGAETWVPIPDMCDRGIGWCGNARGVMPFNSGSSGPASGAPTGLTLGSLDAGNTCTANKSPMCVNCVSINGKCTNGPCAGRECCGDPPGQCNSGGCNGVSGICTGLYIGCPCPGPDYNAFSTIGSATATNPILAQGFVGNQSSTWTSKGNHWIGTERFLNRTAMGQYGLDIVGLGSDPVTGLTSENNVIAGLPAQPFYMGRLGMRPANSSNSDVNSPSLLQQLYNERKIPSLAYGYSAGALYKQQLGSLTFGGYDAARQVPNSISFPTDPSGNLLMPIQSITAENTLLKSRRTLLSKNITSLIDTTTPITWLPLQACQAFEVAFGLEWDNTTQLYLVNDTTHQKLINQNPTITFNFGQTTAKEDTFNITLPYAAFDLQASSPFYANGTNYFPIRRAANSTQHTLGRAFFQEAYLTVDYETANFTVSKTALPAASASNIITINHNTTAPTTSSSSSPSASLSTGAIAGIAVGSIVAFLTLLGFAFFFYRRHRRKHAPQPPTAPEMSKAASGAALPGYSRSASRHNSLTSSDATDTVAEKNWPTSPSESNTNPFSPSQNGTLVSSASHMSSKHATPVPPELEDPTSPLSHSKGSMRSLNAGWPIRGNSLHKPLPKPPQELAGSDAVDELMQKNRGSDGEGLKERVDSRGSSRAEMRRKGSAKSEEERVERRVKHIYEMMG